MLGGMSTLSLKCERCNGPRSRYSFTGKCSLCERKDTDAYVALAVNDIATGVKITQRMGVIFPKLCQNCFAVLPVNTETKQPNRKYCNRHCRYEWRKKNGIDKNKC